MSREALAYHSGLSGAAIAQIESGRRQDVRLASLVALAAALGVSVDYLVGNPASGELALLDHRVLIYDSDDAYLAAALPFLREGVRLNDCLLAVAARRQARLLRKGLGDDASAVNFHDSSKWYRSPAEALSNYRSFVKERFEDGARWIRIIGEPVWSGRTEGQITAWIRYESMINLTLASSPVTLLCPYDARSVPANIVEGARHTHPRISDADSISASPGYRKPEDFLLAPH